jgi:hypothetical protein
VLLGQIAEIFPERVCPDVRDDDALAAEGRRPAGTDSLPHREPVDRLVVRCGQTGSGAVVKNAILIQEENGSEHPRRLLLDQADERIQRAG